MILREERKDRIKTQERSEMRKGYVNIDKNDKEKLCKREKNYAML